MSNFRFILISRSERPFYTALIIRGVYLLRRSLYYIYIYTCRTKFCRNFELRADRQVHEYSGVYYIYIAYYKIYARRAQCTRESLFAMPNKLRRKKRRYFPLEFWRFYLITRGVGKKRKKKRKNRNSGVQDIALKRAVRHLH